jgi:anti-sigma factor RsiW
LSGKTQAGTRLTRYLLGLISPDEREQLESEYFRNDDAFQEMLTAEDDLIDAYARGELSTEEQHHFEERFLKSAAVRERVRFARTLAGFVPDTPAAKEPVPSQPGFFASLRLPGMALRYAAVGLIAFALPTTWFLVQQGNMRSELAQLRAERDRLNQQTEQLQQAANTERTHNAESTAQIEKLQQQLAQKAEPQPQSVNTNQHVPRGSSDQKYARNNRTQKKQITPDAPMGNTFARQNVTQLPTSSIFDLTPGTLRSVGGRTNTITVPKQAKFVVLRLGLETTGYEYYRAVIETADGSQVRSFDRFKSLTPTSQNIELPFIPASELPVGVYIITLHAQQPDGSFLKVGDYSFTVAPPK